MSNFEPKYSIFGSVEQMLVPEAFSKLLGKPVTHVIHHPMDGHSGLAGGQLSYVETNAGRCVLKQMSTSTDWLMYSTDDHKCRAVRLWQYGLLDQLCRHFDHKIVAASRDGDGWAMLMEDLTGNVFQWDKPFPPKLLPVFLDALARTHALFWNDPRLKDPRLGLGDATSYLKPVSRAKKNTDTTKGVIPEWLRVGWESLKNLIDATTYSQMLAFLENPQPLLDALSRYPSTLLHGDFRSENLGYSEKPIILDWQWAACSLMTIDLPWLTKHGNVQSVMSEEDALYYYRERLEAHLGQRFDDQYWQAMVALGYAVDALRWTGFAGFFYQEEQDPEGRAWAKNSAEIHGLRVMDALRWL
jgi:hypothetical protein